MSFRDGPFNSLKVPLTWAVAAAVVLALAGAAALFMSDRGDTLASASYSPVRKVADQVQKPVSSALAAPVRWVDGGVSGVRGYFFAVSENRRLKRQLKQMNDLKAELAAEKNLNGRYVAMLGLKIDPPIDMVSGRTITDSRGPYANSRLVDVGAEAGVKVGNPALSENGLIGRVVGISPTVSRILMLTDVASRTPVMIERTNARAILTGDGGPNPKLAYLRSREAPHEGDVVVSSGDGGLMPRGLPVGVVAKGLDGGWRVRLASDRGAIDIVRILKFQDFAQLANTARLAEVAKPADMGGQLPATPVPAAPRPVTVTAPAAAPVVAPATRTSVPAASTPPAKTAPAPAPSAAIAKAATPPASGPATPPAKAPVQPVTPAVKAAPPAATIAPATTAPAPPAKASPAPRPPVTRTYQKVETPNAPPVTTGAAAP